MKSLIFLFAYVCIALTPCVAQSGWTMDKSHSSIIFTVSHMVISEVSGRFTDFDVALTAGKEDFSDGKIDATITTASVTTANERRDGHLKSNDFFNADSFPQIRFVSNKFEKTGEKTYKLFGDLTIRDITKPVAFDVTLNGTIATQRGTVSGWTAVLTMNRFDYNLKWDRMTEAGGLVAGKDVTITVNAEFRKQQS